MKTMKISEVVRMRNLFLKKLQREATPEEEAELRQWSGREEDNAQLYERIFSAEFLKEAMEGSGGVKGVKEITFTPTTRHSPFNSHKFKIAAAVIAFLAITPVALLIRNGMKPEVKNRLVVVQKPAGNGYTQLADCLDEQKAAQQGNAIYNNEKADSSAAAMKGSFGTVMIKEDKEAKVVEVSRGSEYRLILADGTKVHLSAESQLTVPGDFSSEHRQVSLEGEAYFEVAKDPNHPFTIDGTLAKVHILGTHLNVEAYRNEREMVVTLKEGRLVVDKNSEMFEVPVGYEARITQGPNVRVLKSDVYERTAWHEGRMSFSDSPLIDIATHLERWYDIHVSFSSDKVRNIRLSMDLSKADSFQQIVRLIEMTGEVHVNMEGKEVMFFEK